jgi:predicted Zn-dependent peptidase
MLIRLGKQVSIHLTLFFFFTPSSLTMSETKIDLYDLLTDDELDQVTNIFLEALAREKGIQPEVFELETNILLEQTYWMD